jgi:hypothetical protein
LALFEATRDRNVRCGESVLARIVSGSDVSEHRTDQSEIGIVLLTLISLAEGALASGGLHTSLSI